MTTLILVRHGETDWNAQGRVQGFSDIPLNETGRRQVECTAAILAAVDVAAVYASDLFRAAETGRILARPHELPVTYLEGLRERKFGVWEGLTIDEIMALDPDNLAKMRAGEWFCPEGAETFEEVRDRVGATIEAIAAEHAGHTVVFATHGGPVKSFVGSVLRAPVEAHQAMRCGNASVTTVLVRAGRFILESFNVLPPASESALAVQHRPEKAAIETAL